MTTETTIQTRRCIGSSRFGIEAHDADASDFPVQPSQKDGLGRMCTEHWRTYVKGLREARMAASPKSQPTAPDEAASLGVAVDAAIARETAKGPATRRAARKAATTKGAPTKGAPTKGAPTTSDLEVQEAEALIAEVDALPGPEHVKRVGEADVQAALELVMKAAGNVRHAPAETPLGEDGDGGQVDAA